MVNDDIGDDTFTSPSSKCSATGELGDYFKQEQLHGFLNFSQAEEGLGLDPQKLYVTVFRVMAVLFGIPKDDEAIKL